MPQRAEWCWMSNLDSCSGQLHQKTAWLRGYEGYKRWNGQTVFIRALKFRSGFKVFFLCDYETLMFSTETQADELLEGLAPSNRWCEPGWPGTSRIHLYIQTITEFMAFQKTCGTKVHRSQPNNSIIMESFEKSSSAGRTGFTSH